jgi:hypothetical protein
MSQQFIPGVKPLFKVVVAGGRDFQDYRTLNRKLDKILSSKRDTHEIIIISGNARGVDRMGETYARKRGYKTEVYPADWNKWGKAAGPRRNAQMAKAADAVVVFWDGHSRGTSSMIGEARKNKLPLRIIMYDISTGYVL